MNILGINTGHDAAAALYVGDRLAAFCKEERVTRIKSDSIKRRDPSRRFLSSVDEVLAIAGIAASDVDMAVLSRMYLPADCFRTLSLNLKERLRHLRGKPLGVEGQMRLQRAYNEAAVVDPDRVRAHLGLRDDCAVRFANHHLAHILGAYAFTTWEGPALYVSADGAGDGICYSAYGYDGRELHCLYGGDDFLRTPPAKRYAASIGQAYSDVTRLLGFKPNRHEGKITGLAAFGEPVHGEAIAGLFSIDDDGVIDTPFAGPKAMFDHLRGLHRTSTREELAASIQYATEKVMTAWVRVLLKRFPAAHIGLSGGVFSNVRLNQCIAEIEGIEEVFVCPPMGDEGLPVGNCIHGILETRGLPAVPRRRLGDCYLGRPYGGDALLAEARGDGFVVETPDDVAETAAGLLADGRIGAIFVQSMEMGPRALGGRSILASPADRGLNDTLNERLERTEFMPFAPYVLDEDARTVFDIDDRNWEACRFMTITTGVKEAYRPLIPAVVHVDNTARPQIVERETNPLYYDILRAFRDRTGIPCLVNTSFNAHEEPIINTPGEALRALADRRVDFLVCETGLVFTTDTA